MKGKKKKERRKKSYIWLFYIKQFQTIIIFTLLKDLSKIFSIMSYVGLFIYFLCAVISYDSKILLLTYLFCVMMHFDTSSSVSLFNRHIFNPFLFIFSFSDLFFCYQIFIFIFASYVTSICLFGFRSWSGSRSLWRGRQLLMWSSMV